MDQARAEFLKNDYTRGFPAHLGIQVIRVDFGIFETLLRVEPRHLQQDDFVHAGVMSTMADHTAGYAAYTTVDDDRRILSVEYKINFMRPAAGKTIICRSRVINNGYTIKVTESEVFSLENNKEKPVAKAQLTMMAVPAANLARTPA